MKNQILLLSRRILVFLFSIFPGFAYASDAASESTLLAEINKVLFSVLFLDISFGSLPAKVPLVVVVLIFGALFFTFYYGWINIRAFKHSIEVIAGKFDKDEDEGEISHFRALTSALSATVGLGNIAGVAIAIQIGGPGAVFWMMATALFGMSSKFSSCTLGLLYRKVNEDGSISGGPMYYLDIGLAQFGGLVAKFGKVLAVCYAVLIMGGALGGGNMFQANQTIEALRNGFGFPETYNLLFGLILAFFVAVVILGGIKRIAAATSKIVPAMCAIYVAAGLFVILSHVSSVPAALQVILQEAFTGGAFAGGFIGVLITGVQRAAFSNEAGLGSASIIHAAAKTNEPVREGIVAMIGPFIDTIVICLVTSLVVIVTGTYANPELAAQGGNIGVTLTSEAFRTVLPWFPMVLTVCIVLFAYSTMISWCYYGERGWIYLMNSVGISGKDTLVFFRIAFVCCVVVGAVNSLSDVIDFTDALILGTALPNIIGSIILAHKVKPHVISYMQRLKDGEFDIST